MISFAECVCTATIDKKVEIHNNTFYIDGSGKLHLWVIKQVNVTCVMKTLRYLSRLS